MRAWELSFEVQIWRWVFTLDILPTVWTRWLVATGNECWSQGSLLHVFAGPVHFFVADYDVPRLVRVGVDINRNSFWWDKPIKKHSQ